jgi:hypothetical protein
MNIVTYIIDSDYNETHMTKIVELKAANQTILVETSDLGYQGGIVSATALETAQKNLDKMLEMVKPFSESLLTTFDSAKNRIRLRLNLDSVFLEKVICSLQRFPEK